MADLLREAQDLQPVKLAEVSVRLAPLLAELRQLRQSGSLTPEISRIFQDALLLQVRTQTKLLAPEPEIVASFHELLVINPKLDESAFNPRERSLLEKVRSSETGQLSLKTHPAAVRVFYGGTEMGISPLELPLISGTYRLLLRREGYRDDALDVTIRPSELLLAERTLRRLSFLVPLSANVEGAAVLLNGQALGKTQRLEAWIASLPPERREPLRGAVSQWGSAPRTDAFFVLPEVTVEQPVSLELRAPCYQPLQLSFTVAEQEVDWSSPIHVRPELRQVELKRDTGFMEVTSVPSGAEVWIDGAQAGKTPLQQDICVGAHRVQVLHAAGQYLQQVLVQRDQATKVAGEVRPALLFLGVYAEGPGGALQPVASDRESVARQLVLRGTAFVNHQLPPAEIETLRRSDRLPLERMMAIGPEHSEVDALVRKIAAENGRVDLLLFGVRTGKTLLFRLFSTIHPLPDLIELPGTDENSLAFLAARLNAADRIASRLFVPHLGVELSESPYGLAVQSAATGRDDLAPGAVVRAVDKKQMNLPEFQSYQRTLKPGQSVTLDLSGAKGAPTRVILTVALSGAEYPWKNPEAFPNAVLCVLRHLVERDPISEVSKFARLSLARGLMEREQWKLALEYLVRTNLEPHKDGVCPGTVLYHQGRCYEALADVDNAITCYTRAKDYSEATLGARDGLPIPALADWRIQILKRLPR